MKRKMLNLRGCELVIEMNSEVTMLKMLEQVKLQM